MSGEQIAAMIRERCVQKGWDIGRLARESSVSRATLSKILQGRTPRPHFTTLSKLASVLDISPEKLGSFSAPNEMCESAAVAARRRFDEATNSRVAETIAASPDVAADWSDAQWDELYSTFGVGGQLTPEGVRSVAESINRKSDVVRELQVVLESHLGGVAETLIHSLYRMIALGPAPGVSAKFPKQHDLSRIVEIS